ncbi:MAG: uncharacterized protein KVP18_003667 [Porospora cf. gigantea A]|uniref:uncharacterized protein n=1 Tax=Porospora cf. gigantea A TaxID=2853593 RepID=UPI00355A6684|nr:MAG: hypothetical protein KVP18_003667 [Porospora cf. gigantea A]
MGKKRSRNQSSESSDGEQRNERKKLRKARKAEKAKKVEKTPPEVVEKTPPEVVEKPVITSGQGSWDTVKKEFTWNVRSDLVLRVSKFRGQVAVDIRHLWNGNPTKKGIHVPVEVFKELQQWSSLNEALRELDK